jgi:hypothetical protein
MKQEDARLEHWQIAAVAGLTLFALILRLFDISKVFLWADEAGFFNQNIFGPHPKGLIAYAWGLKEDPATTNTWLWPGVMWLSCRVFGATVTAARIPFAIVGAITIPAVFSLIWTLIPTASSKRRFAAAFAGAAVAAFSIVQLDFSQRVFPYAAVPFASCAIIIAHLRLLDALQGKGPLDSEAWRVFALYCAAGVLGLCTHPSLALLIGASGLLLFAGAAVNWRRFAPGARRQIVWLTAACALILAGAAAMNQKNPRGGTHSYLAAYYHAFSIRGVAKLGVHVYDLAAYHLNLFYNTSLYWPERPNPALAPLILVCGLGWAAAALGRMGRPARRLAWLAAATIAMTALLSTMALRLFPFGGVRQTMFLCPFLFAFTAFGFYYLLQFRGLKIGAVAIAAAYLIAWAVNLPRFYSDRLMVYEPDDIVNVWRANGRLPFYVHQGTLELYYATRGYPEIQYGSIPYHTVPDPKTPYFLISTRSGIDDQGWLPGFHDALRGTGQTSTLLLERPAKHPESGPTYFGSLYFPPSGLWIYKVTPAPGR